MWTQDPAMKAMFRVLERVAGDDVTVLVRGETGSGKELVAAAIHALSGRRKGPFRAINCAALPSHLLESELFGHARGAFTGAVRDTPGHVQLAHRGTLFLDEVAELPLELQAKLLRVVETRTVIPVGAREPVPVDVRFVSATHRALRKEVEAGRFRADLMYRLRVIPVFIPSLRERPDDIPLLVEKFMAERNETSRRKVERVAPAAMTILRRYSWPGNVRELKNVLAYAYAMGDGPTLAPADLPPELVDPKLSGAELVSPSPASEAHSENPEARRILEVLGRTGGNRQRAAQILGMSRVTLWRRMRELGLAEQA
ncbi:AAA domain-containing protein [Polyangium spumosum]|uniref:AAA domain-containing protein n=2 Tax=Polyangium spumosum TaxID=889282 RepID=A0A6N7PH93_9BACT|nr:sigma 54-interacting transcriptional regulator [Polyangium spumosum]MRG91157.1 AAA domain-containing protein [Polyangium spumosum]